MNLSGNGNPSSTVKEVRKALMDQMYSWAKPRGGDVMALESDAHLWEYVYNRNLVNEAPKILVLCRGARAFGEYEGRERTKMEREIRMWGVVLIRGNGFKDLSQQQQGQPGTPGFYEDFDDVTETIRDGIRVMSDITAEDVVNYKGWRPLSSIAPSPAANVFIGCRIIEFETAADIPSISTMQRYVTGNQ